MSAFGSPFTDKKICAQLRDPNYQRPLSLHGWDELLSLGPDFVLLSDAMWHHWEHGKKGDDGVVPENTTQDELWSYVRPVLVKQLGLESGLCKYLLENQHVLFLAMKEIAESYLVRAPVEKSVVEAVPQIKLIGNSNTSHLPVQYRHEKECEYQPAKFIAAGSASRVWLGSVQPPLGNITEVVLKQINNTQKDSAFIEFSIAKKLLKDSELYAQYLMLYIDLIQDPSSQIWLVLEKIAPTQYGIDLTTYISTGFFQPPHQSHSRKIVCDLLLGLHHIASRRVILRDLKADNVLLSHDPTTNQYNAKWTDFGLAVDLDAIRRPKVVEMGHHQQEQLKDELVGFWYDTQKLVPRPTWKRRRPTEDAFKICSTNLASYDIYMFGVLVCSMATSIDWAHIEKPSILQEAEKLFGKGFAGTTDTEIKNWDIYSSLNGETGFKQTVHDLYIRTFGDPFGKILFGDTLGMLQPDWTQRPTPLSVYERLTPYLV